MNDRQCTSAWCKSGGHLNTEHNASALRRFGEEHIGMDGDSPNRYFSASLGRLATHLDLQYLTHLIRRLPTRVKKNPTVLDVGAGKGRLTKHLLGIAGSVVAIEPFQPFFEILSRLQGHPALRLEPMTLSRYAENCPERMDLICMSGVVTYLEDREVSRTLKTARHLLQPWGVLFIRDYGLERRCWGTGRYGSMQARASQEILRPPEGFHVMARDADLVCESWRRAYPPIKFMRALGDGTLSRLLCRQVARLNLPRRRESFFYYVLNQASRD